MQIDVSVGQTVVKGQVLAKLNKTSLQDALNAAQATVLSAQTGVNNAEANLSKTEASIKCECAIRADRAYQCPDESSYDTDPVAG